VGAKRWISGDYRQALNLSLGDRDAVEGVPGQSATQPTQPHFLQGSCPQDLPPQLAQLLDRGGSLDLLAYGGRQATEALSHLFEEHGPKALEAAFFAGDSSHHGGDRMAVGGDGWLYAVRV
jgi:hypothetical protein